VKSEHQGEENAYGSESAIGRDDKGADVEEDGMHSEERINAGGKGSE
jgi:hypothetical protein